jgi:hypothetical protein
MGASDIALRDEQFELEGLLLASNADFDGSP